MKARIKVEYNIKEVDFEEMMKFDEDMTKKIESIGGEWYAQGFDEDGNRDICFDIILGIEDTIGY